MVFKPKKQQIHVPGCGVVQKEDFTKEHYAILMKRAGSNKDAFIKQHLEVASYDDLDLFKENKEAEEAAKKAAELEAKKEAKEKAKAEAAQKKAEEAAKKNAGKDAE